MKSLSLSEARAHVAAHGAITAFNATDAGTAHWRYGTVRLVGRTWETRAPGSRSWRPLASEPTKPNAQSRAALKVSRALTAWIDGSGPAFPAEYRILANTFCSCGRMLTTPQSILSGEGPECSGRAKEARARAEAKRAHVRGLSVIEMRSRATR